MADALRTAEGSGMAQHANYGQMQLEMSPLNLYFYDFLIYALFDDSVLCSGDTMNFEFVQQLG
jgi:hypothetical protein